MSGERNHIYRRLAISVQMKVSVIGTPGSERAVFLGLLYETLIRMSTSERDMPPQVVVNAGPVEAKALGDLRLELLSGRWPSLDDEHKVSGCALELGFRKSSGSFFGSRGIRKVQLSSAPLSEKDVKVMRSSGQLREVLQGSSGGSIDRYGLDEQFREALDSETLILLADISTGAREGRWSIEERDAFLATVIENASRTRLGKERRIDPLVVMTGADRAETDDQQVFENMYPRTAKALRKVIPGDDPRSNIFVSWLATVPDAEGIPVPASIMDQGQVQIDYSEKEYRRLIGRIGDIAQ